MLRTPGIDRATRSVGVVFVCLALMGTTPKAMAQDNLNSDQILRGLELFLDGLQSEMDDQLSDLQDLAEGLGPALQGFIEHMGPALNDLMDDIEDWSRYEAPEMLPNGDIIIRRRQDAPPVPGDEPELAPDGSIDL